MARWTLFWKLASWPFTSRPALSAMMSHQRLDPGPLVLGEVLEHVMLHHLLDAGMADADAHAAIIVADMRGDRAQPVVAGDAAAGLDPHLGGREVDLVVEHHDVGRPSL